jgi:hypothetical protein
MKYKEKSVTGQSWTRSFQVIIENKLNETPYIRFDEEEVFVVGDNTITQFKGDRVVAPFSQENSTIEFPLMNPITNEVIAGQTAKYEDIFVLLYSLYHHLAEKRDIELAKPYPSWVLDETNTWIAPVPMPDDGKEYEWSEFDLSWVEVQAQV